MGRVFYTLDVFTATPYAGNPLAVVTDTEGLDTERMQAIAREFNLSETVFVLPAENPAHTAKVRIFTPQAELPFAGHPTVGTAVLLATQKYAVGERPDDALVVLEEGVGPVRVGVRFETDAPTFAEFDVIKLPEPDGPAAPADRLAAALGLAPNEIGFENHKSVRFSAGVPFTFVPVRDLDAIGRAAVMSQHWGEAFSGDGHGAAFVYCRDTVHRNAAFHARMFAPEMIAGEDPATGAAAAAFPAVIRQFDTPPDGVHTAHLEQGYEMNRPSDIYLEFEVAAGNLRAIRVGGQAVQVMKGEIEA